MKAILEAHKIRCSGIILTCGLENTTDCELSSNTMVLVGMIGSQVLSESRRSRAPEPLSTLSAGRIALYKGQVFT